MTASAGINPSPISRPRVAGKFLQCNSLHYLVKGVSYGTFAPDETGNQFPDSTTVKQDFTLMRKSGVNTVRTYTVPPISVLDEAARQQLKMIVGVPWTQHVAFLDDRQLIRNIRRSITEQVRRVANHPTVLLCAIGNEIPPNVVRWHRYQRIEKFLRELYDDAKSYSPDTLLTYVNYPPTHFLELPWFDICAFNVFLHNEHDLRSYVGQLHHIAGSRPLLLTEVGADSIREGQAHQATLASMQIRTAFAGGVCGAVAFSWTDEWWRDGEFVDDWAFGLVDKARQPKPALTSVAREFNAAPFSSTHRTSWPKVSVLVCAYNAAFTLDDCLCSLEALDYPSFEIIVVNDGSTDATSSIANSHQGVHVIDTTSEGLSVARNVALAHATGEIVAYTDADVRVHSQWLTYLIQPFLDQTVVGAGGPNIVPPDDSWLAQCVARSPGAPTHVMLDDVVAEHVPGCNMAFRRDSLLELGGFNPIFDRAADDIDVCWRFQASGEKIGFSPAALVWHHHRSSVKAYWKQQFGYGFSESWLTMIHPEKFVDGQARWHGRIYSPLPWAKPYSDRRLNTGPWGTAAFPSVYHADTGGIAYLPHRATWKTLSLLLIGSALTAFISGFTQTGVVVLTVGSVGLMTTVAGCLRRAMRFDISSLPAIGWFPRKSSRAVYFTTIAALHFIQPIARAVGRFWGSLSPPGQQQWPKNRASYANLRTRDYRRSFRLAFGHQIDDRYWGKRWVDRVGLLTDIINDLRGAGVGRGIEVDDGWQDRFDLRIHLGQWERVDLLTLIEEHSHGKSLLRIKMQLSVEGTMTFALGLLLVCGTGLSAAIGSLIGTIASGTLGAAMFVSGIRRLSRIVPAIRLAIARVAAAHDFEPVDAPELATADLSSSEHRTDDEKVPVTQTTSTNSNRDS